MKRKTTMAETKLPKKIPGWKLVWHDEFDGDAVDRGKWDFDIGNGFYDYKMCIRDSRCTASRRRAAPTARWPTH